MTGGWSGSDRLGAEPSGTAGAGAVRAGDEAVGLAGIGPRTGRCRSRRSVGCGWSSAGPRRCGRCAGSPPDSQLAGQEREDDEEEAEGAREQRAPRRARVGMRANVRAQVEKPPKKRRTLSQLSVTVPMLLP